MIPSCSGIYVLREKWIIGYATADKLPWRFEDVSSENSNLRKLIKPSKICKKKMSDYF